MVTTLAGGALLCGAALANASESTPGGGAPPAMLLTAPGRDPLHRRIDYARAALARGLAAEAWGAMSAVMRDNPAEATDRGIVTLAATVALRAGQWRDAASLAASLPASDPAGCVLRVLAAYLSGSAISDEALLNCAARAGRTEWVGRAEIARAVAGSHLAAGRAARALELLGGRDPDDVEAALLVGVARHRLRDLRGSEQAFAAARVRGTRRQRVIEEIHAIDRRRLRGEPPARLLPALARLDHRWRGGNIERIVQELRFDTAVAARDYEQALRAGAVLVRRYDGAPRRPEIARTTRWLAASYFGPASRTPLIQVVDVYWAYRDLLPQGSDGDEIVRGLAGRLAAAGLHGRAAAILEHQALKRSVGPGQVYLATLAAAYHLLADDPAAGLAVLDRTVGVVASPDALARHRAVHAVAAVRLGRVAEARAMADALPVPSSAFLAELYWAAGDLRSFLRASADPGYPYDAAAARQVAVMRAVAAASLARSGAVAPEASGVDAIDAALATDRSATAGDVRAALAALPKSVTGDRLLALALGCPRLGPTLNCA